MSSFHLILCQVKAGSAMRVSGTIVRMTALPAETQQKIIVKLHSFNAFQQDLCAPSDRLRNEHYKDQCAADDQGDLESDSVKQHEFGKITY